MSRTFKIDSPGKVRNQMMRTSAELLRRLSQKPSLDGETKDIAAMLMFCLREIAKGIDESSLAWEKRNYWLKAERFRQKWSWAERSAKELEDLIRSDAWDHLPVVLVGMLPHFASIKVTRFTRKPNLWKGAYARLMSESPQPVHRNLSGARR